MTENQPYLHNRKAYELQIWYVEVVRRAASPTCAVTSNLKALGDCSSHHLLGAGSYCGGLTTGCTACYCVKGCSAQYLFCFAVAESLTNVGLFTVLIV